MGFSGVSADKSILDLIRSKAPKLWDAFNAGDADEGAAGHVICQLMALYTDGENRGYLCEPFLDLVEVSGSELEGLTINNPKARVFVGKNCKFEKSIVSGSNDAFIFIGRDTVLTGCEIACHASKTVFMAGFSCRLEGIFAHIYGQYGFVVLSPGVTMQAGCNLCIQENSYLLVGSDAMFSNSVFVRTSDSYGIYDQETGVRINPPQPVTVHPHAWISRTTALNKGTEVGQHTIVSQGSITYDQLEADSIYAGAPAHQVRTGVTWDRRTNPTLKAGHEYHRHHFLETFSANVNRRVLEDGYSGYSLLAAFSLALASRPSSLLRSITFGSEAEKDWLAEFAAVRSLLLEQAAIAQRLLARPKRLGISYSGTKGLTTGCVSEPRVACLMMQKDEASLLKPWLDYHAHLFGLENLFVWDNGSTDAAVLTLLDEYGRNGLNVDYSAQSGVDFRRKGVLLGEKIKELERRGDFDFLIPIDCDELFACERAPGSVTIDRRDILEALRVLMPSDHALGISVAYNNILGYRDYFWRVPHRKTFFRSGTFKRMDHGFHYGEVLSGDYRKETAFTYLHFHHKPYSMLVEHSRNKMRPYHNVDDLEELKALSATNRLARFIVEGEEVYRRKFSLDDAVQLEGLSSSMAEAGVEVPFADPLSNSRESVTA